MALNSHVSVEHIHNIKSMREMPDFRRCHAEGLHGTQAKW